ncbi:zinc ABC transporter permease [Vibrio navarrensis]|uniref:Metal ABC transporter permease n=1 Tax=Vibrio navarrensis TaxID=29495 RepID=A0AAJ4IAD6_9VIBR|nr:MULTISPECIES: metal ABC transporter permease [Vibrio]KJR27942.1 zinc ABC transporter permease [Vibrio sp. S234-5]MBE3660059.1 zinc ABC transporter permease [Vibrio navarrensis]MBE4603212.1 zinc ABC transporter permease [Vibrio navarrensis]QPL53060.1 metal ABC transporter permease [Vibrio navarrensis]
MSSLQTWLMEAVQQGWLAESFQYAFMLNALIAAVILGPLLGGLGTLVIAKRLAFFSEAVGHAAITGIAIGILLGEDPQSPMIGLFSFCLIFALMLHYVRSRTQVPYDTLVGVFLSCALALGAALLMYVARKINIHLLENVLFGSILTVTEQDIALLALVCFTVLLVLFFTYNRILLCCLSPDVAKVRGHSVAFYDYLFVLMITLVTIVAVKVIGAVLVGALLLIPGATARLIARDNRRFVLLSALLATLACLGGTLLPVLYQWPLPSGAAIILLSSCFFVLATLWRVMRPNG